MNEYINPKSILLTIFSVLSISCAQEEGTDDEIVSVCGGSTKQILEGVILQNEKVGNLGESHYCFNVAQGEAYSIVLNVKTGSADMYLYYGENSSSAGPGYFNQIPFSHDIKFTSQETTLYYIEVYGMSGSDFDISVSNDPSAVCSYYGVAQSCTDSIPYSCSNSLYCSTSPGCFNLSDC